MINYHNLYIEYSTVNPGIESLTGLLFEGDNISCASASTYFNVGSSFTVVMWVYITDLVTE
jgi:hypothetical protein